MNSEELELSLRTEFENYLNGIFGRMRQDVSDFQKTFEAEFEKHKLQMEQAFQEFSSRFDAGTQFDKAFTESVTEHLRLARDEGAKITEAALSEAAKLDGRAAAPQAAAGYDRLRDAISDIGAKNTQSAILKSLVEHASEFTPRGAFFIARNDRFVCWKVFGKGLDPDATAPDVQLAASDDTILADSVRSLSTTDAAYGKHEGDAVFLESLGFGQPDRMYAVPLTARGRGVAVLYADYGADGVSLNLEAIETLVRVAGLTVELQAASQAARTQLAGAATEQAAVVEQQKPETQQVEEPKVEPVSTTTEYQEYVGAAEVETSQPEESAETFDSEAEAGEAYGEESENPTDEESSVQDYSFVEPVAAEEHHSEAPVSFEQPSSDFAFTSNDSYDAGASGGFETVPSTQVEFETAGTNGNGHSYQPLPQAVVEPPVEAISARSRFSSRNMDLPIEVSEGERKLHNEARRFARLLVSEIKLYNEQQVKDAREAGEIYLRLRDAIDRSREMYENRVKPEVKAKFDYFHYEIVNGLADGNAAKLGGNYPGAAV